MYICNKKYFNIITNFNELKDGDWIFTKNPSHVAMWYKGKMFGQNQEGRNDGFTLKPFTGTFIGAYRDKANTDKDYKNRQMLVEEKRTEVEIAQLNDGNPYNNQIKSLK